MYFEYSISSVFSDSEPPDSIPNSAVKPVSADGTFLRESRSMLGIVYSKFFYIKFCSRGDDLRLEEQHVL